MASHRKEKQTMVRHDFLVLALAIVLNHTACGTDNSRIGGTAPEPPAQTSSKQADSMKIRSGSEKVTIEPASQSSDQASEVGLKSNALPTVPTLGDVRMVAPALARYTQGTLLGDLWKRPDLSPRDRSIITVAALIARNQTIEMPYHFNLALDNGVKPSELSEIITHLAFYSGWANATAAVAVAKDVFGKRGIGELPADSGEHFPIDEAAEAQRAARVEQDVGPVAPGLVQYTSDLLFHDLWLRPELA
jgi:alkylhydroperoxidase/carboxymuconolactone decarboxylase family protein YurZ